MQRYVVGIDLGTTHTVVASASRDGDDEPEVFPVPQLVAAAEVASRPLLPSCLFAAPEGEGADPFGDAPWVLGERARRRGAEVPGRLVASAKSWLAHARVDREAAILPWGADDGAPRLSPVEASARLLAHVHRAWDAAHPGAPLASQTVVLTLPASFDEDARELTVAAAARAGLAPRLLEEPQAAFLDHAARAGEAGLRGLLDGAEADGVTVLVCDVGGGTTDLSLLRVAPGEGEGAPAPRVTRVAVGPHLLLGGDNMDLALAHLVEPRLAGGADARLDAPRFAELVLACRAAKERLLSPGADDAATVTVLGGGARLVGGARHATLTRGEVAEAVLGGFFPEVARDARPERARAGLVAFGLPYERDPAITRHLAAFLARHAAGAVPRYLLLNGGVFHAEAIAARLDEVLAAWAAAAGAPPPLRLAGTSPDVAVARGAVWFGRALSGRGLRIRGGAARGLYIGVDANDGARRAVCVVPRGAEEGTVHRAAGRAFALAVGRVARFDLWASDVAGPDAAGDVVAIDDEAFAPLPPLVTRLDAGVGEKKPRDARVQIEAERTAIGTLDLACVEVGVAAPRRFRLAFSLDRARDVAPAAPAASLPERRVEEARAAITRVFGSTPDPVGEREVKDLFRTLEKLLGDRARWPVPVARALFDELAKDPRARRRTADHERLFFQLAGFCVRPGFGEARDAARVARLAPLFAERLAFPETRSWQALLVCFRRAAGGLAERAQESMRDVLDPLLAPPEAARKRPKGWPRDEVFGELLELAGLLERVPAARKQELGAWILERTWTSRDPRLWAALGRLGARVPAYGGVHQVPAPKVAEEWLSHLLREKWGELPSAARAATLLARRTDDRARDVSPALREEVARRLEAAGADATPVRDVVDESDDERAAHLGDALPPGLRLLGERA